MLPSFFTLLLLGGLGIRWARGAQAAPAVDAKIQIVWPHLPDGRPGGLDADLVNVEAYLFQRGALDSVPCSFPNKVTLRWALNKHGVRTGISGLFEPTGHRIPFSEAGAGAVGRRVTRTVDGRRIPVWVFDDVKILAPLYGSAKPARATNYFVLEVEDADYRSNVWAHADDPRTYLPNPLVPRVIDESPSEAIDAWIQVVFPHAGLPDAQPSVLGANLANVGVDLFRHPVPGEGQAGSIASVGFGFAHPVRLLRALNDGYLETVKEADRIVRVASGDLIWPRWEFDNIDVSAARDPANKYYFAVSVSGRTTHTTIWSHGADARTHFPQRDVPNSDCAS